MTFPPEALVAAGPNHVRLLAYLKAAYSALEGAGELAVTQGAAYHVQRRLLNAAVAACRDAAALIEADPDLEGWTDSFDVVWQDLVDFGQALVMPDGSSSPLELPKSPRNPQGTDR